MPDPPLDRSLDPRFLALMASALRRIAAARAAPGYRSSRGPYAQLCLALESYRNARRLRATENGGSSSLRPRRRQLQELAHVALFAHETARSDGLLDLELDLDLAGMEMDVDADMNTPAPLPTDGGPGDA